MAAGKQYNGYLFMESAVEFISEHDPSTGPLFLYMAPADAHSPLQAPQEYLDLYPEDWYLDRRQYAAMCSFWDSSVGNITAALKAKNIWDNTLFVFSSDNGGPTYWSVEKSFPHGAGANNWPLKGSKVSAWEGGIRVAAFASGGLIPAKMRGSKMEQKIIISDWYGTFCAMAGVDVTDKLAADAGLPPVDSVNLWPLLSGADTAEPHDAIPVVVDHGGRNPSSKPSSNDVSALLMGNYKLLVGKQALSYWQGPAFPNASSAPYGVLFGPQEMCSPCLFDVFADPGEHNNLAGQMPDQVAKMQAKLAELRLTAYANPSNKQTALCQAQVAANGNFYGPFINGSGPAPGPPIPPASCKAAMQKDGCLTGKRLTCELCAVRHKADVTKVCDQADIKALCQEYM